MADLCMAIIGKQRKLGTNDIEVGKEYLKI